MLNPVSTDKKVRHLKLVENKSADTIYIIKVTLRDCKPPIWRRFQVPGSISLFKLHRVLQVVMGWKNYHLYQFIIKKTYYGEPNKEQIRPVDDPIATFLAFSIPYSRVALTYRNAGPVITGMLAHFYRNTQLTDLSTDYFIYFTKYCLQQ